MDFALFKFFAVVSACAVFFVDRIAVESGFNSSVSCVGAIFFVGLLFCMKLSNKPGHARGFLSILSRFFSRSLLLFVCFMWILSVSCICAPLES